jgi:hypothetical protein
MLNEKRFRRSWEHTRTDMSDQSMSSYDMSLATLAVYAEWTDQEVANLLIAHRRERGNPEKGLRSDYLERTLTRARQASTVNLKDYESAEIHRTAETREAPVDESLAELSMLLALDVQRVVQRGLDPANYSIETEQADVFIGNAEILLSPNKARAQLIASSRIYIPKMKPKEWERVVALMVHVSEYEEIGEGQHANEASSWVASYLAARPCSTPENGQEFQELVVAGDFPIKWEGQVYLQALGLKTHIFGAMGEKVPLTTVCTRLRGEGLTPERIQVRTGNKIAKSRVWKMNSES